MQALWINLNIFPRYQKVTIQEWQDLQVRNAFFIIFLLETMVNGPVGLKLVLKHQYKKKKTKNTQHPTHTTTGKGREKGKETMQLAVSSLIFICLLYYFLLSPKHSTEEEEVTTSRIFSKPSSEHRIFRGIYLKIINKKRFIMHCYRLRSDKTSQSSSWECKKNNLKPALLKARV